MKPLRRVKEWMEWRAIQVIGIAFSMLIAVASFGLYTMAILIAAELSP